MNKFFISVFFIFLNFFLGFSQSVLHKIEVDQQLEDATLVVEAKVIEKKSYRSLLDNHIYTLNTLKILGIFKGEVNEEEVLLVTKGGGIGFESEVYYPSLKLRKDQVGLFLLKPSENEFETDSTNKVYYKATHSLQSFFEYQLKTDKVANPFYNYDTIEGFQESIKSKTNNYIVTEGFSLQNNVRSSKSLETPVIRSIAPTSVRAGVGDEISIIGENFGDQIGTVTFSDSDNGGFSSFEAFDSAITSWSNTNIIIKVPALAGTGTIQVFNSDGEFTTSERVINVLSSEVNAEFDTSDVTGLDLSDQEFRAKFVNDNDGGGYTWTFDDEFYANTDAVDAFTRSVETWVCESNINWVISDLTLSETPQESDPLSSTDGVNLVSFGDIGFGILAVTVTHYSACLDDGELTTYVEEVDVTFSSNFNWYYGEDANAIGQFENDFQGTATHELGHAHNLGHVIAPNNLMHFETDTGLESATREVDEDSSIGAALSYEFSKTPGLCDLKMVFDRGCDDTNVLNITDDEIRITVQDDGDLVVLNSKSIVSLGIYDMQGRTVIRVPTNQIDISNLSTGVYVLYIENENGDITIEKIVKP